MAHDDSWPTDSWKASPWKDGSRQREVDSDATSGASSGRPAAGGAQPGAKVIAGPTGANGAGGARLADLREWHIVEARCARCRHVGRLRPKQLTAFVARRPSTRGGRQLAGQTRLADILERFACSECGNRAGNAVAVVAIERNG